MNISATFRLLRFHKPVGTLLLWFPTAWALWLANQGAPPTPHLIYFFLGTFLMRSAGCVLNDMADRHVDQHVKRTKKRPLTTGEISIQHALLLLTALLLAAFAILVQLPKTCFYYALGALAITILYPFCKRFFEAPQLILGIAFSLGIPMAYAASGAPADLTMGCLMALNFFWIVAYDTLYAMADRADDLRIGVKSTAILFGKYGPIFIVFLQGLAHGLWLIIAWIHHFPGSFYSAWFVGLLIFIDQQRLIHHPTEAAYLQAFSTNAMYGLIMWLAICLAYFPVLSKH